MATIEEDLKTALDAEFTDLNGRVYPMIMPQDTQHNAITYRFLSQSEQTCMVGDVWNNRRHVQIDVWAGSYAESVALAARVSTALHANFTISGLFTVDIYEDFTLKYRRVVDFRIL